MGSDAGHSGVLYWNLHPDWNGNHCDDHLLPRVLQCPNGELADVADRKDLGDIRENYRY